MPRLKPWVILVAFWGEQQAVVTLVAAACIFYFSNGFSLLGKGDWDFGLELMRLLDESRFVLRSSFFYFGSHACIDDKPVKRSAYRYGYRHPLPKFQVVIPLAIREALHLTPGEKLRVLAYSDRVEFQTS